MPRQTRKWLAACNLANELNIEITENRQTLYRQLEENNYYWRSNIQEFVLNKTEPDPPTNLIKIRIWADTTKVEGTAYQLRIALEEQGYVFCEQSGVCNCRPPKQLESRIYMTFK